MAEFTEVMRQAKRICQQYLNSCEGCPLANNAEECRFDGVIYEEVPEYWRLNELPEIERIVMDWAEKHPEPRYPTWKEWQETEFPNNDALMRPCIFESEEYFNCKQEVGCEKCMNRPIPAEIAEKLGIKPIGGVNDG